MTNLTSNYARCNRVFVKNRVRYNRVSNGEEKRVFLAKRGDISCKGFVWKTWDLFFHSSYFVIRHNALCYGNFLKFWWCVCVFVFEREGQRECVGDVFKRMMVLEGERERECVRAKWREGKRKGIEGRERERVRMRWRETVKESKWERDGVWERLGKREREEKRERDWKWERGRCKHIKCMKTLWSKMPSRTKYGNKRRRLYLSLFLASQSTLH